jgi:hypothetical protein
LNKGDDILIRKTGDKTYTKAKLESINHKNETFSYLNDNQNLEE